MAFAVKVTVDTKAATNLLKTVSKQLPYALSLAATDLAKSVQKAEKDALPGIFKHPRPFTLNSVSVAQATKAKPLATVYIRPEVAKYLKPYEDGGLHILPGAGLLNPKDVNLDAYGQMTQRTMAQLKDRKDVFVGKVVTKDGKEIMGFWQRLDVTRTGKAKRHRREQGTIYSPEHGALKLLVRFGTALPVKQHLDFKKRAHQVASANGGPAFARAIARALATAK